MGPVGCFGQIENIKRQSLSKGSDDTCKVHMQVEHGGGMYYGFGCSTDIVAASIEAYVDALNKFSAV